MDLQYFVGKFCTILTTPINRDFKEENPASFPKSVFHYFLGFVESIQPEYIIVSQPATGLKTVFFRSNIVGLAEEEVLDEPPPEAAIEQPEIPEIPSAPKFINIEELSKLTVKAKNYLSGTSLTKEI